MINSLPRRASLWYLGPLCGLGSPFTWLKQLANRQTPLCLISLPTLLGDFVKFSLLSYNLHTIQFSCFMYTIQWFLVYLQSCVTITTGIGLFFFVVVVVLLQDIGDLISPTRDQTHAACIGRKES